jgi:hypothetical protein
VADDVGSIERLPIINFAMTGKASFGDLVKSIIAGLIRIQLQETKVSVIGALAKALGMGAYNNGNGYQGAAGAGGQGSVADFYAMDSDAGGYDIPSGRNPVTQLHEREMVLPAQYADVIRSMAGNGGGGVTVNVINQNGSQVDVKQRQTGDGLQLDVIVRQLEGAMADNIAYGTGPINAALQGRYGLKPAM